MPALQHSIRNSVNLGNEIVTVKRESASLTVTTKHDVIRSVSTSPITLWTAASDLPATFKSMSIVVDPTDALSGNGDVMVEVTASGVVVVYKLDKRHGLTVGPSSTRPSFAGADGNITLIRAQTASGTVAVRCTILD